MDGDEDHEEARRAAEDVGAALRDALWDSSVAIALFDRETRFIRVNEALARLSGAPVEAHPGRTLAEVAACALGDEVPRVERALRRVIETGRPCTVDLRPPARNGAAAVWRCSYHPIRREARGEVRGVCALVTDVTPEREREAAVRRARAEADRARALLDAVFENAPIGIAFLDTQNRYVRVNAALATMNGVPAEAHLGRTPREVFPGLPAQEIEKICEAVIATGEALLDAEMAGETPSASGRLRYSRVTWFPVRAGDETLGVGALVRETTAEREAEEFQRHVVGVVGHDLRTPLSAIRLSAELLRTGGSGAPDVARLADRILANVARMDKIIGVLVDYARARGGQRIPLDRKPCVVPEIVRAVVEESEAAHPGRRIATSCSCRTKGAEWDPDRIAQVLANLLGNALEYSPPASAVTVHCRDEGADFFLEVSNEGPAIPPEDVPRLFEPFRRDDRGRAARRSGLGLGLFIVRAIVTAHGGDIEVRSGPGERTVFTVRLPRGPAPQVEAGEHAGPVAW